MAEIILPYVKPSTLTKEALDTVKKDGSAGLVFDRPDGPALITKDELQRVSETSPYRRVCELSPTMLAEQIKLPRNLEKVLFGSMARRGIELALAGGSPPALLDPRPDR
jgi:hypothetical protein